MTQRTYQHLNETLATKMVELEASAALAMLNASAGVFFFLIKVIFFGVRSICRLGHAQCLRLCVFF
jgi:hypothetical protein